MAKTATAKVTRVFACSQCGAPAVRWAGRCGRCGEFGTIAEQAPAPVNAGLRASTRGSTPRAAAQPVGRVFDGGPPARVPTGIGEFDRVVGGGLVAGQVLLLSGEPGAGKSTLLLTVADSIAQRSGRRALYVSGEESVHQIAVRARRISARSEQLYLADETDLSHVIGHIDEHGPDLSLIIVDSVQTIASVEVDGRAGGVAQVMEVAQTLTRVAKSRGTPLILVGQVTKDSNVAGPRALEHIVDTTLSLDGDRHTSLRLLRTVKNRFGSLEVAAFEQTDTGMEEVVDPSTLFRGERETPIPGTCVTVTVEGRRALLAEVQALVAKNNGQFPRRNVSGLDAARAAMLIAVTERAARVSLGDYDVYLATLGGMRLADPGADLATCLAVYSAASGKAVPLDLTAVGEVALSGDLRPVPHLTERMSEAVRLGYRRLIVPAGSSKRSAGRDAGADLLEVKTLAQAIDVAQHR